MLAFILIFFYQNVLILQDTRWKTQDWFEKKSNWIYVHVFRKHL